MSSYNFVNDTKVCENRRLISEIPRKEWNWDGVFVTGRRNDSNHIKELKAGHVINRKKIGLIFAPKICIYVDLSPFSLSEIKKPSFAKFRVNLGFFGRFLTASFDLCRNFSVCVN